MLLALRRTVLLHVEGGLWRNHLVNTSVRYFSRKKGGSTKVKSVDSLIKGGFVKKASELPGADTDGDPNDDSDATEDEVRYVLEVPDDPSYSEMMAERGVLSYEVKKKRVKKAAPKSTKKDKEKEGKGYAAWLKHRNTVTGYEIGPQDPDDNGNYTWSDDMNSANSIVFGNESFKPYQLESLNASMCGDDVFVSLPTGGGKSLCFQLRAILSPGITFVVSPLISLIQDQVNKLKECGVPVLRIDSTSKQNPQIELQSSHIPYKLVYVTPERIQSEMFQDILLDLYKQNLISLVTIDEAHCISEWGHDFRKSYRRLNFFREELPNVPIMSLTATATTKVRDDILQSLHIENANIFSTSFNRPNIYYEVRPKVNTVEDIVDFLHSNKLIDESGIIYCLTKNDSEELADQLRNRNINANAYHSNMTASMRSRMQNLWNSGSIKVLCTTTAFGLGVDKLDVRYIIHHAAPLSLEGYYQQTGRAGRDGKDAICILYYADSDFVRASKMLASGSSKDVDNFYNDSQGLTTNKAELMDSVVAFCNEKKRCRRVILMEYFGEKITRSDCHYKCDNCQKILPEYKRLIISSPDHKWQSEPFSEDETEDADDDGQEDEEGDEEGHIKLSPLQKVKQRRQKRKELEKMKFAPPSLVKQKQADRKRRLTKSKQTVKANAELEEKIEAKRKKAMEKRIAKYYKTEATRRATIQDRFNIKEEGAEEEETRTQPMKRGEKKEKTNKTGRITQKKKIEQRSEKKPLQYKRGTKLNKTGKINTTSKSTDQDIDQRTLRSAIMRLKRICEEPADIKKTNTKEKKVKPTPPFSLAVLESICRRRPTSIVELTSIPGVGIRKVTKYAEKILSLFREK